MTPTYFYGFSDSILQVVLHEPRGGRIPEALVQDIWLNQRLRKRQLTTVDGVDVDVLHPGRLNTDAGPDFVGARLRLGTALWSGAVEVHVTSGGWQAHHHEDDARYNSTLLHVALYHDVWTGRLRRPDETPLPEVVLYPYLEDSLRRLIHSFYVRTERDILCAGGWSRVRPELLKDYLRELAFERLAAKSRRFTAADPHQALYEAIFGGLGYAKNAGSMRTLAGIVPLEVCRAVDDGADLEALFIGSAGLLPAPADLLDADRATADYVMELRDRFERLNHGLNIVPMPPSAWRFFRLRPANFPTLRIAQGAALLGPAGPLRTNPMSSLAEAAASKRPIGALRSLFDVRLSPFWSEHVRLEKKTQPRSSTIGRQRIDALLVNVVLPALLARRHASEGTLRHLLERLPSTADEVTRLFAELGSRPASALEAQGFHQLYKTRCTEARCLACRIGQAVLEAPDPDPPSNHEGRRAAEA